MTLGVRKHLYFLVLSIFIAAAAMTAGCGDLSFIGDVDSSDNDDTDFIIDGLKVTMSEAGQIQNILHSNEALLHTQDGVVDLVNVQLDVYDGGEKPKGVLTANKGLLYITDRPDLERGKNDFDLEGDIRYDDVDGSYFRTDWLKSYHAQNLITSDAPVIQGTRKNDSVIEYKGNGFTSDRKFRDLKIKGGQLNIRSIEEDDQQPAPASN